MIRAIILDFDGVILESVSVKTDAFRTLFSVFPEHVDRIVQFHLDNGGMSRFEKFHFIYNNILHRDLSESDFNTLSSQFSDLVEEAVAKAPFVDGAPEFLEKMSRQCSLFIVSATPEDELVRIVKAKGIAKFFSKVSGAPAKKTENISQILSENMIPAHESVFIGDAVNDWDAAQKTGVRFIGRIASGDTDRFEGKAGVEKKGKNLFEIAEYLEKVLL